MKVYPVLFINTRVRSTGDPTIGELNEGRVVEDFVA